MAAILTNFLFSDGGGCVGVLVVLLAGTVLFTSGSARTTGVVGSFGSSGDVRASTSDDRRVVGSGAVIDSFTVDSTSTGCNKRLLSLYTHIHDYVQNIEKKMPLHLLDEEKNMCGSVYPTYLKFLPPRLNFFSPNSEVGRE